MGKLDWAKPVIEANAIAAINNTFFISNVILIFPKLELLSDDEVELASTIL